MFFNNKAGKTISKILREKEETLVQADSYYLTTALNLESLTFLFLDKYSATELLMDSYCQIKLILMTTLTH